MQEMGLWSPGQQDPLETGMTTHSSILAWRIPWTEEPGGLQSWGHKESDMTERLSSAHTEENSFIALLGKGGPQQAVLCLVTQSCPTLCDPMNCSPPDSSVHEILQARILEWVAMPSFRGSSQLRD